MVAEEARSVADLIDAFNEALGERGFSLVGEPVAVYDSVSDVLGFIGFDEGCGVVLTAVG